MSSTKVTLRDDRATGLSSTFAGANLDSIAFNLSFISKYDADMAKRLMSIYEEVRDLERLRWI